MKKFTIGIAVLAVAALAGYTGTTYALNNGKLLSQVNPNPGYFDTVNSVVSKSQRDPCAETNAALKAADDRLKKANRDIDDAIAKGKHPDFKAALNAERALNEAKRRRDAACKQRASGSSNEEVRKAIQVNPPTKGPSRVNPNAR